MTELEVKLKPEDVADYFLAFANESGDLVTNLKLQKLVYYAQAWYLANKGKPLFADDFQAWVHGPVLPSLYTKYKNYGFSPIQTPINLSEVEKKLPNEVVSFLNEVAKVYMPRGAYELEMMTHREAPWIAARGNIEPDALCHNKISKESMKIFYGQRLQNTSY